MDFLQTYPQVAEYVEEFEYFGSLSFFYWSISIHMSTRCLKWRLWGSYFMRGGSYMERCTSHRKTLGLLVMPAGRQWKMRNACKTKTKPGMLVPKPTGKRIYLAQMGNETVEADIHVTCIGANGTGKGTSLIIPNCAFGRVALLLMILRARIFKLLMNIVEIKWAGRFCNRPVQRNRGRNKFFNPMDYIDSDETGLLEARKFAEAIFPEKENGNAFFDNGARNLITITMLYVKLNTSRNNKISQLFEIF